MAKVISHDFALDAVSRQKPTASKVRWSGAVTAIQPRAWVWRYKTCNRRHNHTGFNLWIKGEGGTVVVAISGLQQSKLGFRHGDAASGTAWPVQGKKREIADLYRAGDLQVLSRSDRTVQHEGPPFIGIIPDLSVYELRGCRMLDAKVWRLKCQTCMWANKSRVEIEYVFGKSKRYRSETFCYGPKSCRLYAMGDPREVPYRETWKTEGGIEVDDGNLDNCLTSERGEDA